MKSLLFFLTWISCNEEPHVPHNEIVVVRFQGQVALGVFVSDKYEGCGWVVQKFCEPPIGVPAGSIDEWQQID